MDIVIGYQNKEHVTAEQLGRAIAGLAGDGTYLLATQNGLAASMQTANQVRIDTGDLIAQGRVLTVETPETLTVESGVTGEKRNDLVVARYEKDPSSNVESAELVVVKGTPVSYGDPSDPSVNEGSILDGDSPVDVPLFRIPIDGLAPGTPERLIESTPSITDLRDSVSQIYNLTLQCTYWRAFGTVFLSWQGVTSLRQGWNTIGTLPEGFRPTSGFTDPEGTRVSGLIKMLGNAGADSTGTIDVYSSGLARVWFPRSTNDLEPSSGQVFFRAD